jgi:tetratricopeptide (TPR) repeat protein
MVGLRAGNAVRGGLCVDAAVRHLAGISPQGFEHVKRPVPYLILLLLAAVCFSLATAIQPRASGWSKRSGSDSILKVVLGDSRRLFANHFFVEADVSFHSGYYPSVFDQALAPKDSKHMTSEEGSPEAEEHEKNMNFFGPPRDWIERFGRHFLVTEHKHLQSGNEREILPWLKLSAELDPQRTDTYVVAAYWLRRLGKTAEAEQFLRDGLRSNPASHELLFELGRLCKEDYHDTDRARNLWELAVRRWREQEADKKDPDLKALDRIAVNLAHLEEQTGNLNRAIDYLEMARKASPSPEVLQQQIEELKKKAGAPAPAKTP